jgi:hypothetical protein
MELVHEITIDLLRPKKQIIKVTQEDSTRRILLTTLSNGAPYDVTSDLESGETLLKMVEYRRADGISGIYDTTSDGRTAVESGGVGRWLVNLDGTCFTVPGWAQINVRFMTEGGKLLHTFAVSVRVQDTACPDESGGDPTQIESIADMKAAISTLFTQTMSEDAKLALLNLLSHVAYVDEHGQDYLDNLEAELFRTAELVSISAVFDQADAVILDTYDLETLRQYLTVTATYEDMSTREITGYTLSGTLTEGTSTITVSYGGKTTTFTVTVKHNYADTNLANWLRSTSGTTGYADGVLSYKANTQNEINSYYVYVADRAKTLWSEVVGKTLKVRLKVKCDNFDGTTDRGTFADGIYANSSIPGLGTGYRLKSAGFPSIYGETNEYQWYEATITATLENMTGGTGTPTAESTFGLMSYSLSLKYAHIIDAQIYEVDAE